MGGRIGLGPRDAPSENRIAWPGSMRSPRETVYSRCASYGILDGEPYGMERGSAISWPEPGRSCERGEV